MALQPEHANVHVLDISCVACHCNRNGATAVNAFEKKNMHERVVIALNFHKISVAFPFLASHRLKGG
jgi:hypothetical protein